MIYYIMQRLKDWLVWLLNSQVWKCSHFSHLWTEEGSTNKSL